MSNAGRRASTPYRKPTQPPTGAPSGESPYTTLPVAEGFGDLRIPAGFETGVRRVDETGEGLRYAAQPDAIGDVAKTKTGIMLTSISRYNDKVNDLTRRGKSREEAVRDASVELDDSAALIKDHLREVDPGDPPVVADLAIALMGLPPAERQMILRRAGSPSIFSPLENAVLADTPEEGAFTKKAREAMVDARKKQARKDKAAGERGSLHVAMRPSSFFQQHGVLTSDDNQVDPSEVYKKRIPADVNPMQAKPVAEGEKLNSVQKKALQQLAGDQLGEIAKIQRRQIVESKLYTQAEADKLTGQELKDTYDALEAQNIVPGVRLPEPIKRGTREEEIQRLIAAGVVGEQSALTRKQVEAMSANDRLTLLQHYKLIGEQPRGSKADTLKSGTSLGAGGEGTRSASWKGQPVDRQVSNRNRSGLARREELLYRLTEDSADIDTDTGKARTDHNGKPIYSQTKPKIIDLDKYFPWWRARIGDVRPDGTLHFPKKQKSAEWVTMQMQGWLNNHDPDFFRRMLPLVQRSIAAMPTRAVQTMKEGDVVGGGKAAKGLIRADQWEKEVWVPSAAMQDTMRAGPGTKDYPHPIYSDVDIDLDDVEAGTGTPQPVYNVEESPTYKRMMQQRQERQSQPGKTDSASMNSMPQYTLLRSLIA